MAAQALLPKWQKVRAESGRWLVRSVCSAEPGKGAQKGRGAPWSAGLPPTYFRNSVLEAAIGPSCLGHHSCSMTFSGYFSPLSVRSPWRLPAIETSCVGERLIVWSLRP